MASSHVTRTWTGQWRYMYFECLCIDCLKCTFTTDECLTRAYLLFQAVNYTTNALQGKVIQGRVAFSCGNTMWLDPIEHKVTLKGMVLVLTILFCETL